MTADVVAMTGTNGKTTTTALRGAAGAESGRPVLVGGNIGRPLAAEALPFPADGWWSPRSPASSSRRPTPSVRASPRSST